MRKLLLISITFALLTGCASIPNAEDQLPIELQRSSATFDSVNNKIFGDAKNTGESMASFNLSQYEKILATYNSDRAREFRDMLESYDTKVLKGYEKTFVFCIFSSEKGFAMCDDARCTGVEKIGRSASPEIIETWLKDLPLASCQKH